MEQALFFRIDKSTISVSAADGEVALFVDQMLGAHAAEPTPPDLHVGIAAYRSSIREALRPRRSRPADYSSLPKVDTAVWAQPSKLWCTKPPLHIGLSLADVKPYLQVSGEFIERPDHVVRRHFDRRIRPNNLQVLLRSFILRPFFLLQELRHGVSPLHAAMVVGEKSTLLLVGLSGVGKSTLAVRLGAEPGWRLVTDNYAGYDSESVFGVQEPLRLSDRTVDLVGEERLARIADPLEMILERRRSYALRNKPAGREIPTHVVYLTLGTEFRADSIRPDDMAGMIDRASSYLGEFHSTSYEELLSGLSATALENRHARTRRFVTGKSLHVVTIAENESLDVSLDRLRDAIQLY